MYIATRYVGYEYMNRFDIEGLYWQKWNV